MNHKLLEMLNEAGFEFTPDIMAKLPAFENLVWLEREACANVCDSYDVAEDVCSSDTAEGIAIAIRARGQHDN
jgi:hypothetical protein